MTQRRAVVIGAGIPALAVVLLLLWGVLRTGGEQGRPGVNAQFGEVEVSASTYPGFELPMLDGGTIALQEFRGKIVVVDFWASWCPPCRSEGPILAEAYRDWSDRGVEFVGIAIWDDESSVREFIDTVGIEYATGMDDRGHIAVDFGVRGLPEKFFVMPDGEVVKKVIGPSTRAQLDSILSELTDRALGIEGG